MEDIEATIELETIRIVRLRAAIAFRKRQRKLERLQATADNLQVELARLEAPAPAPVACKCSGDQWGSLRSELHGS